MIKPKSNTTKIKEAKSKGQHVPRLSKKQVDEARKYYAIVTGSPYMTLSYSPLNLKIIKAMFSHIGDTVITELTDMIAKRPYLWTLRKNEWEQGHISINHARWIKLTHDLARKLPPPWLTRSIANGAVVYLKGHGWIDRASDNAYSQDAEVLMELVVESGGFNSAEIVDFMRGGAGKDAVTEEFKEFVGDNNPMPMPPEGFRMDIDSVVKSIALGEDAEVTSSDGPDTWVSYEDTMKALNLSPPNRLTKPRTPTRFTDIKNDYTLARVDKDRVLIVRRKDSMYSLSNYAYQAGEDLAEVYKALVSLKKVNWVKHAMEAA